MAWHTTKDPLRQRAYFLKGIQQFAWWPGKIVHNALEHAVLPAIKEGRWPSADRIVLQVRDLAKRQFLFSKQASYRNMSKADAGDDYCVLAPHYFEEPLGPDALDGALAAVEFALRNLLNSEQMKNFLMGRQWYRWEYPFNFKMGGAMVRAVPDLLMFSVNGQGLDIVDWKVAMAASSYHFQVAVYALAARETSWLADYARRGLWGYVVNLSKQDPAVVLNDPYTVDDQTLAATVNSIYESVERIRALTGSKKYDQLDIGRFEYAQSPGTCVFCNWRQLCVELGDGSPAESFSNIQSEPTQLELPLG
jgi:hypothetical protein